MNFSEVHYNKKAYKREGEGEGKGRVPHAWWLARW